MSTVFIIMGLIFVVLWFLWDSGRPTRYRVETVEALIPYLRWLEGASRDGVVRVLVQDFNLKVNLRFWSEDESETEIHLECLSGTLTRQRGLDLKAALQNHGARMRYYRTEYPPRLVLKIKVLRDRIAADACAALAVVFDSILPRDLARNCTVLGEGILDGPRYWSKLEAAFAGRPSRNRLDRYLRRKVREYKNRPAHPAAVGDARRP